MVHPPAALNTATLMEMAKLPEITLVGLNYKDTNEEAQAVLTQVGNPLSTGGD